MAVLLLCFVILLLPVLFCFGGANDVASVFVLLLSLLLL